VAGGPGKECRQATNSEWYQTAGKNGESAMEHGRWGRILWAMSQTTQVETRKAAEIIRVAQVSQAPNGVCYTTFGETGVGTPELEKIVGAVPPPIAAALERKAYFFVPLALSEGDETLIAERYTVPLGDRAACHRNYSLGSSQFVFISTRLMDDKFSVAFEFFINVGHAFVERAGVSEDFAELAWAQAEANVRGETSLDAYEFRKQATTAGGDQEKARNEYLAAAFSDAIAIYLLSLTLDFDYYDLRERDYPLLAPPAMAERLRKVNELFPANKGYDFAIHYRRRA
jgi:hypothetical protein